MLLTITLAHMSTIIFHWQRGDLSRAASLDALFFITGPAIHMLTRFVELIGHDDYASFSRQSAAVIEQNRTVTVAARFAIGYYLGTLHALPLRARVCNVLAQQTVFALPSIWVFARSADATWLDAVAHYVLLPVGIGSVIALMQELVVTRLLMRLAKAFTDTLNAQTRDKDAAWAQQCSEHEKRLQRVLGYLGKVHNELNQSHDKWYLAGDRRDSPTTTLQEQDGQREQPHMPLAGLSCRPILARGGGAPRE